MSFPPSAAPITDVARVLCVAAHPDDIDFGAAGTVAGWVDRGIEVTYLLVTRGDAGGFDATPRHEMPRIREAEQRAAAAVVGVTNLHFLDDYRDGQVVAGLDLRRDIAGAIRRYRPDRVLTTAPLRRWDRIAGPSHPDHLAVGEATTCAVYPDARNEFAFPELIDVSGLAPWTVREIWYSGGPDPDHTVDITATFPRKLEALRAHASQVSHLDDLEGMLRRRHGMVAKTGNLPDGALAEAFTIINTQ